LTKAKMILGIDPGLDGAVALLAGDALLEVWDIPTFEITLTGSVGSGGAAKKRRRLDTRSLYDWLVRARERGAAGAVLEEVHASPQMGVSSAFTFGRTVGEISACVRCAGIPLDFVSPNKWKKDLRVPSDKDAARMRATDLLPDSAGQWARKKDHNRAEAALIAWWAKERS